MNSIQTLIARLISIRIPDLTCSIHNKAHKFGEVGKYFIGSVVRLDSRKVPALFTKDQLLAAIRRADRNPEDVK